MSSSRGEEPKYQFKLGMARRLRAHGLEENIIYDLVKKLAPHHHIHNTNGALDKLASFVSQTYQDSTSPWYIPPPPGARRPAATGKPVIQVQQPMPKNGSQRSKSATGAPVASTIGDLNCPLQANSNATRGDKYSANNDRAKRNNPNKPDGLVPGGRRAMARHTINRPNGPQIVMNLAQGAPLPSRGQNNSAQGERRRIPVPPGHTVHFTPAGHRVVMPPPGSYRADIHAAPAKSKKRKADIISEEEFDRGALNPKKFRAKYNIPKRSSIHGRGDYITDTLSKKAGRGSKSNHVVETFRYQKPKISKPFRGVSQAHFPTVAEKALTTQKRKFSSIIKPISAKRQKVANSGPWNLLRDTVTGLTGEAINIARKQAGRKTWSILGGIGRRAINTPPNQWAGHSGNMFINYMHNLQRLGNTFIENGMIPTLQTYAPRALEYGQDLITRAAIAYATRQAARALPGLNLQGFEALPFRQH